MLLKLQFDVLALRILESPLLI
uniref:26s proteasome non-atpase regulatory subunit 3 n=1 Tax=Triatoma infestans TaxID=30076 RepID=A0A161MEM0_TRIIF